MNIDPAKEAVLLKDVEDNSTLRCVLHDNGLMPDTLERGSERWKIMMLIICSYVLGQRNPKKDSQC